MDTQHVRDVAMPRFETDRFVELDARLAWKAGAHFEPFVVGHDLLDDRHAELTPHYVFAVGTEVQRSVYVGAT